MGRYDLRANFAASPVLSVEPAMTTNKIRLTGTQAMPVATNPPFGRFLAAAITVFVTLIAGSWVWATNGRMWFLDPEYGMWVANIEMSRSCSHGEITILGDSRAKAGLVPSLIGTNATNLALGGGTPIEAYYLVERILKCSVAPKHVILSFPPKYFGRVEVYWQRSALFGFLTFEQMEEVRRVSWQLNDPLIYSGNKVKRLFHSLKNLSYAFGLPSYYFPAMTNAGFFMRKKQNDEAFKVTMQHRGHHFFGTAEQADWLADETRIDEFKLSPLLDHYFSKAVSRLLDRGVRVWFVGIPVNPKTLEVMGPEVRANYLAYLHQLSARDARFHVVGEVIPWLQPDHFGDAEHLNRKGATAWSKQVRDELARLGVDGGSTTMPQ